MNPCFLRSAGVELVCRSPPLFAAVASLLFILATACAPLDAQAQTWSTETRLRAATAATTNGGLAPGGEERKDLVTAVTPSFAVDAEGLRFKLRGFVSVDLVGYARGSQSNRIAPTAEIDFAAALVERLFFLDSSVDIRSAQRDPFAARADNLATSNSRTAAAYRVSPFLRYEASPLLTLLARQDEEVTQSGTDELANRHFSRTQLRAERRPAPYGGSIELVSQRQRYSSDGADDWNLDALLLKGDVSFGGDLVVGPLLAYERSKAFAETTDRTGIGAHLRWSPNERLLLAGAVQQRFFGTGWELNFRHRTPLTSFQVQASRTPANTGTAPRSRLNTFLDSILTTRYPDASARGALVANMIAVGGFRNELASSAAVVASYPQVQGGARAAWVFLGSRNTVSVSAYHETLRTISRPAAPSGPLPLVDADNRQAGAAIGFNRRLTPQSSIDLTSSWSRIRGLGDRDGDESTEWAHRLTLTRQVSLRTAVSAGLQYRRLGTNATGADPFSAADAFVGLNHRF
ncbi:MAG: TIGR03016 family PEP-CTERM system-associated outer membrane protein [Caldimonas sp.]